MKIKNNNFISNKYYSNTYMFSHGYRYRYYITIGSRGRGKTFSGKKYICKKAKYNKAWFLDHKMAWIRLTSGAVENILASDAITFFEKELLDKYNLTVTVVDRNIYLNGIHIGAVMSLQEYYALKGNQFTQYEIYFMDELVREATEKRTFNIPKAFINTMENLSRQKTTTRCFIYCNTVGEMREIYDLFGFMPAPGKFGVYKLYHKAAIIEYLEDSIEWKKRTKNTMSGILQRGKEDTQFSNKHEQIDLDNLIILRKNIRGLRHIARVAYSKNLYYDLYSFPTKNNQELYYVDWPQYCHTLRSSLAVAIKREYARSPYIFSTEYYNFLRDAFAKGIMRFPNQSIYDSILSFLK